jgi:hypothetical protein
MRVIADSGHHGIGMSLIRVIANTGHHSFGPPLVRDISDDPQQVSADSGYAEQGIAGRAVAYALIAGLDILNSVSRLLCDSIIADQCRR